MLTAGAMTTADEAKPADFDAVPVVKSPVTLKHSLGSRSESRDRSSPGLTEAAVMRSLRWLKSVQNPDGSWGGDADAFVPAKRRAFAEHARALGTLYQRLSAERRPRGPATGGAPQGARGLTTFL